MKIYDLKNRDFKKYFREFRKSAYGKIVFCLSYAIPLIMFLAAVETAVISQIRCGSMSAFSSRILIFLLLLLISFILGTRYFYKEFKEFLENVDK